MSLFITAYKRRTATFEVTILDSAGNNVIIAATDVIRVKVGRNLEVPVLDLDSIAATTNGSTVSAANPTTIRFDQEDINFAPGVLDIEVGIVDDSDSDAFKHAEEGVFNLISTQAGDIGLT